MKVSRRTFLGWSGLAGLGAGFVIKKVVMGEKELYTGKRHAIAGKTPGWLDTKVFDADTGEELKHVVSADERTGRVVRLALDKDGNIRHTWKSILEETEYRRIRIERPA